MHKIVLAGFVVFMALCVTAAAFAGTTDLIANGNFSSGLSGWNTNKTFTDAYVNTDNNELNFGYPNSTGKGNEAGAYQTLNMDVSGYDSLHFKCSVMAMYQSLPAPGYCQPGIEYPVQIWLRYTDTSGITRDYRRGFYYSGNGASTLVPGIKVTQNSWYDFESGDLFSLTYKPKIIQYAKVFGSGHTYDGKADDVQLLGERQDVVPEPATMALLGLGTLGLGIVRRKRKV